MRKEIVSLILEKDGKILVEKRKKSKKTSPGAIIFPAGHINEGESKKEALIREMKEELGIDIVNPKLIYDAELDVEEKEKISWFRCEDFKGSIVKNEAEELKWIDPSENGILTHEVSREALFKFLKNY